MLLEPPAPAARVLLGRALAILSFWSAAARRRIAVRAPPGGGGEDGRAEAPVAEPVAPVGGEAARGDDYLFCGRFLLALGFGPSSCSDFWLPGVCCCGSERERIRVVREWVASWVFVVVACCLLACLRACVRASWLWVWIGD